MKISQLVFTMLLVVYGTAATAQVAFLSDVELGVKGGPTFTHGFTTLPGQMVGSVQVPDLANRNDGLGYGYSGGLWARKDFSAFFVQAEVTFNRFVLKQKGTITVDINANPALANALPVSVQPGLLNATLNVVSESVLQVVDVPMLIGRRWMDGRLRGYAGPSFVFIQKATATRTTNGILNANPNVAFPETDIPATTGTTNLLNKYEARSLEAKDFTYALAVGAGYSPLPFLDVDLRYSAPVGGIYRDSGIKGFLGMATLSIGFKVY